LEAPGQIGFDPAADERQAIRRHPALVAEAAVDRLGILVAKRLDHHEEHARTSRIWRSLESTRSRCQCRMTPGATGCALAPGPPIISAHRARGSPRRTRMSSSP